ncbi:pentapeptide repeat-containing protein [Planktomarina temperata]|uniref:pentapeptide repeat-containing protein n=1 Tax=Planktomarina temperata TaxID=1284658 RepID=UPI003260F42A
MKLILWAHEDSVRGTERWNGFIKYLVEERLDTDSAAFKSALPLSGEALEHAKNFFPNNADFKKDQLVITIENHIFSEELNFNGAIFAQPISFTNCRFKRSVNFYKANFERAARFSGSKFLETVDFGNAQFRVAALFERVTFCGKIIFYWSENESNLLANFRKAIFKKMTPVFHGRNFHPAWDFHGVTWPKIPKRNGDKKTQDTIEDTLLYHITSYEYICTQAENIGQLELRKEMIRRELACRAELAEPSFERYLRKAYGWICDHGTSIGRPALALLCIWGFTFAAWRGWAAQEAAVTTWDVLYHTGGRMVPFVGGHAYVEEHTLKALRAAPHVLHFLSAMAAILSPFLLFLMALALRLKFRMSV